MENGQIGDWVSRECKQRQNRPRKDHRRKKVAVLAKKADRASLTVSEEV